MAQLYMRRRLLSKATLLCTLPSKRINNSTQCISQLKDLSTLLDTGGIDKEQYENLQKAILKDIFTDTL